MILRIDDTDVERNTQQSLDSIFEGLSWLGLNWDEQYRQSDRLDLHRKMAQKIFEKGLAYRDFTPAQAEGEEKGHSDGPWLFNAGVRELSTEESDRRAAAGEPFVLRFRVPRDKETVSFEDHIFGLQTKPTADIEDFALLRSNAMPTYHMASCADDIDLAITDIIRGQDHFSNTFKHALIFEAAGAALPKFAHLPLLTAPDGAKLSKRKHGAVVSVTTYRDAGFLPQAYVNFLCLLGWNPKDNREQMTRQELIAAFKFDGVNRANAVVNFTEEDPIDPKALWLNSQHLRSMPVAELAPFAKAQLIAAGFEITDEEAAFEKKIDIIRSRFSTLLDFTTRGRAYFSDDFDMQAEAAQKLEQPGARELLRELGERLVSIDDFSEAAIEAELRKLAIERTVKAGLIINAARAALSGQTVGPSVFAVFTAVGRERVLHRLRNA